MRFVLIAAVMTMFAGAAAAQSRPVVAELFTSEGCSSCPPADRLLAEIAATRSDVLALAFHVTYWNRLGWSDPYALPEATEMQEAYAAHLGLKELFTPQLMIDGTRSVVGNDRPAVLAALRAAARDEAPSVPLAVIRTGRGVRVTAGAGKGRGTLLVIGFDPLHHTRVGRGENAGQTLTEANIVRGIAVVGPWDGAPVRREVAAPAGARFAALLQAGDGRILGAAMAP